MASATTTVGRILVVMVAGALAACVGPEPDRPPVGTTEAALAAEALPDGVWAVEAPDLSRDRADALKVRTDHLASLRLAVAQPYKDGDLCTHGVEAWSAPCSAEQPAGCLLAATYATVYGGELVVGWREKTVRFSRLEWLVKALPGFAEPAMLEKGLKDPSAERLNRLAAEIIALRLNVDLNAHGQLGEASLGEAILVQGALAGLTVSEALELAEQALGGFPDKMERRGLNVDTLTLALAWVNGLSPDCRVHSAFMRQGR
ncbi:MAG: hypothetical protein KC613_09265 [Myxococcales bacterium]|nr:hypothetical protein [Myxococcales bacterium]